jgi:opacity protein-like surface antigen
MRSVLAAVAAMCLIASPVCAQTTTAVTLHPEHPARWDAAFHIGWLGVNKAEIAPEWNNWYGATSVGGSAGYYPTPHIKIELDIARGTQGRVYSFPASYVAGRPREDEFRTTTATGIIAYQFLDNSWFHPFVGAGVDVVRESARVNLPEYIFWLTPTAPRVIAPAQITDWDASVKARPMVSTGFKWYVSERAFVRSELRAAFSSKRTESLEWRSGFGFDF